MTIAELPPREWHRLQRAFAESRSDEPLPKPEQSIVLASEVENEIAGCVGAERVWCVSPFWVRKDWRGTGLAERLGRALMRYNTEGLTEMLVTTSPHVELLVHGMGFVPIKGTLWRR